ncbi:hypothetical protein LTS18_007413, partial [Coniosporium uncinatum]
MDTPDSDSKNTMVKVKSYNYPEPKQAAVTYNPPPSASNPVLRGLTLVYAAVLISKVSFVSSFLYQNAGFGALHNLKELDLIEPRYDPTVIPIDPTDEGLQAQSGTEKALRQSKPDASLTYYSVADYHEAFKSGRLTPVEVVEALLPLIRRDVDTPTKHSTAWLEVKVNLIKRAAAASKKRYEDGKPLGVLDGVPVTVKDEVDLAGYNRSLGSKRDFTNKDRNAT